MSIKIDHIDLQTGDHLFVRFKGCVEHSLTIAWNEKDDLPTVSGPFNCKSKKFKISIHGMELVKKEDEIQPDNSADNRKLCDWCDDSGEIPVPYEGWTKCPFCR